MAVISSPLLCVGITISAATALAVTQVAGHAMVAMPGGLTVTGSEFFKGIPHARPRWIWNDPYLIGQTLVSESEYREEMGSTGREDVLGHHPATMLSYDDAVEYLKKRGRRLSLPTEWQWEAAAGPAVNVAEVMEEELGRYLPGLAADFVQGRFHNLVFGVLGDIFTDPTSEPFQGLIRDGRPFFGWRVHATPSGRQLGSEAWCSRRKKGDGRIRIETAPVDWGPKNAFGLYNMSGNVAEWVQGRGGTAFFTAEDLYGYVLSGVNPSAHDGESLWRACCGNIWDGDSHAERFGIASRLFVEGGAGLPDVGFRVAAALKGKRSAARPRVKR